MAKVENTTNSSKATKAESPTESSSLKDKTSNDSSKRDVSTLNNTADKSELKIAKAGKRSAKALKEAEEKKAKEERKATSEIKDQKLKTPAKPTRSRLERRGKKFRKATELIDKNKLYSLKQALELAVKTNTAKFDATVELHINLVVDPRHADQNIRGTVKLPAGSGKNVKVAVFADVDDVKKAKTAGADIAGNDDFLQQLDKGQIDFDVLIATPAMMPKLGKYARLLGPKGLMPNPKSGTVSANVTQAVKEAKTGKVEYRVDSTGIVHLGVGKTSFSVNDLLINAQAVLSAIKTSKPASLKGNYIKALYVTTTMGPSIKVATSEV